ncbi:hypothetical protein GDO81_017881 [Engystomops pustulosus]|uniref:Uncharacterized protein n=1 Tax=Engystomops pustulosus TaxID=76066 RepID=A0AAV7AB81_ENGPU|nr:hypothetical protein GDO81_017881 [Engystomops pustulosus]
MEKISINITVEILKEFYTFYTCFLVMNSHVFLDKNSFVISFYSPFFFIWHLQLLCFALASQLQITLQIARIEGMSSLTSPERSSKLISL